MPAAVSDDAQEIVLEEEPAAPDGTGGGPGTQPGETRGEGDGTAAPADGDPRGRNLRAALREERGRRRDILAELEAERRLRQRAEQERAAAEERARVEAARAERLQKIDEVQDLSEAVPLIREDVVADVEGRVRPVMDRSLMLAVRNSQAIAARNHSDFYDVLERSGLEAAITLDAAGKPGDPDIYRKIFAESHDPGEDAYQLAQQMLAKREGRTPPTEPDDDAYTLDEPAGDRAQGRREVIDRLNQTASRPRGIGSLPASGPSGGPQRLTRRQIDQMSDAQKERLPEHVREWWLMGADGIAPR